MVKASLAFLLVAAAFPVPLAAQPGNPNPGVIPPSIGSDYGGLSAAWWKWTLETPAAVNPVLDDSGANCGVNQSGPVFFLAGSLGDTGVPVIRICTLPAGKRLFFPVATAFYSAEGTFEEMQQLATALVQDMQEMRVVINGKPVQHIGRYWALSPNFTINLPDDNLYGAPAGAYEPSAAAGYYLLLAPLPAGSHQLEIYARFSFGAEVQVLYTLHVQGPGAKAVTSLKGIL